VCLQSGALVEQWEQSAAALTAFHLYGLMICPLLHRPSTMIWRRRSRFDIAAFMIRTD
jgi:hypothetical protein